MTEAIIQQLMRDAGMDDRSLETRQLDALNDWMEEVRWSVHEAACLFAGVLPPERAGDSRSFGAWLPGREEWDGNREAWEFTVGPLIEHFETVLRDENRIADRTPEGFLRLAIRLKIVPPWAEAFLNSEEHSNAISFTLRSALRELLGKSKEANPRANSSFASRPLNWAEAVERAAGLMDEGKSIKEIADILHEEGFCSNKKNEKAFDEATIRGWRRIFKGQPKKGISAIPVKQLTAPFREWRERVKR
jgi:hypothetical protein